MKCTISRKVQRIPRAPETRAWYAGFRPARNAPAGGLASASAPRTKDTEPTATAKQAAPPDRKAVVVSGAWRVEGNELVGSSPGDAPENAPSLLLLGSTRLSRYELRFRAKIVKGTRFYAVFEYASLKDCCFLEVGDIGGREVSLHNMHAGEDDVHEGMRKPFEPRLDTWYDVRIVVDGSRYTCFLDNKELFQFVADQSREGRVGLAVWRSSAHFRDIVVTSLEGKELWKGVPE